MSDDGASAGSDTEYVTALGEEGSYVARSLYVVSDESLSDRVGILSRSPDAKWWPCPCQALQVLETGHSGIDIIYVPWKREKLESSAWLTYDEGLEMCLSYDTPTGAAGSWLLALDGGVAGTLNESPDAIPRVWNRIQMEQIRWAIFRDRVQSHTLCTGAIYRGFSGFIEAFLA